MKRDFVRIGAVLLLAVAGCSSNTDEGPETTAPGVTGTTIPGNTGAAGKLSAGSGATPTTPPTTPPRAGAAAPTGASGAAAPRGGAPATTPSTAAAGSGGSAGAATAGAAAGAGGNAAAAGSGGAPSADGALVRGEEPTMDSAMKNGPYEVATYTDGFKDGAAFLAGTIYYPKDAEPPFAGIVACPGFTALQDSVAPWGPFLASHGIVVMTIDTNTTGDSVDQRQEALMDALGSLKAEQSRSGSPLEGKLDMTRFGLMGWSMGGGGTWLNANTHPELKTALSLAGHIATQIGGAAQFTKVTVPTLLLAGSADDAILGGAMSQPVYEAIPESTPKLLYEIAGASHFDIQPMSGGGLFGLYGLSWQKVFLEGDERYKKFLLLPKPDNASDFRSNVK